MIEELEAQGWEYRDLPNMLPEFMEKIISIAGEENLKFLTYAGRRWKDGVETVRGQVMVSPQGRENISVWNKLSDEEKWA